MSINAGKKAAGLASLLFVGLAAMGMQGTGYETQTDDWPQWRGPDRTGISKETGLLKSWPTDGPRVVWRKSAGDGYSAISVAGGHLFTMWGEGSKSYILSLDAASGEERWRVEAGANFRNDQGNGPRGSTVVHDGIVYAINARSHLYALKSSDGSVVWSRDLEKEYGADVPRWGYSGSPLIDGGKLFVEIGGRSGYAYAAFDPRTGKMLWHSGSDGPGYSSPIAVTIAGIRQIVFFSAGGLHAVSPESGRLLWKYPWKTSYNVNAAIPVFVAPDKILISSSYGVGAALVRVRGDASAFSAESVWKSRKFKNHFNSSVLHDGHFYGFDNGILKCVEAATGDEKWAARGYQKGSLIYADGHLVVLGERGKLGLIQATPTAFREVSTVQILNGRCWTMPALADGRLYVRNQRELLCLDVRQAEGSR